MAYRLLILEKQKRPREVVPGVDTTPIGRALERGVIIRDRSVSRHHAAVRMRGGELILTDSGSTFGTYLNDRPVSPGTSVVLHDGDVIRFGKVEAVCHYEPDEPLETEIADSRFASQANARLVLLSGSTTSRLPIAGAMTLIGRAPYCEVRLEDPGAPHEQARVRAHDGRFFVESRSKALPPQIGDASEKLRSTTKLPSNSVLLLQGAQALFLYDFDGKGMAIDDPLARVPRRRLLRHVADQSGLAYRALAKLSRDRSTLGQSLGEILVERSLITPLFWGVVCARLREASGSRRSWLRLGRAEKPSGAEETDP